MIDIIIMASGSSRRFGSNKLLYPINGKPMFSYAIDNAIKLKEAVEEINHIYVVSRFEQIKGYCKNIPYISYIQNDSYNEGITASIHLGIEAAEPNNALMFMVCDQPYMGIESLIKFTQLYKNNNSIICMADSKGELGNPCIFAPLYRKELMRLDGDKGGKSVIKKHPEAVIRYIADDDELKDLDYIFPFINEKGHIISIVGAGGKTSVMYSLAKQFAKQGFKTLVATTTHIYKPEECYAKSISEAEKLWNNGRYAVVGKECANGKIEKADKLESFIEKADAVLIEADGARHLPIKVPRINEPVIYPESDIVIGVVGLDCIGKQFKESCFGYEYAQNILNVSGEDRITTENIADILTSDKGTFKSVGNREYYIVLNKADLCSDENIERLIYLLRGYKLIIRGKNEE